MEADSISEPEEAAPQSVWSLKREAVSEREWGMSAG